MNAVLETSAQKMMRWAIDPCAFVAEVLGVMRYEEWVASGSKRDVPHQEKWQQEALIALATEDRIAIRSGKGVGKTTLLSWAIIWFLCTRHRAVVPCTATSGHQLHDILWKECSKWVRQIKPEIRALCFLEVKKDRIVRVGMESENFAIARTARREQPEAFQGFHEDNLLLIADEASGVFDEIFEAGEGAMSTPGAKVLLTGNPTRTKGYFFDAFHRDRKLWHCIRVSCFDSQRVTQRYLDEQLAKWGEESNAYRVGVLGEFPLGNSEGIIPLWAVEEAVGRDIAIDKEAPEVWGLDVARFGDDRCALAKRKGRHLKEKIKWWQGKDAVQTCGMVADEYFMLRHEDRPIEILVDQLGMGGAFIDIMRRQGLPVRGINGVNRKGVPREYLRTMDWLAFQAREWFMAQDCVIPDDKDFIGEVTGIDYDFDQNGKKFIPDKRENVRHSPDLADAFFLTFATNFREVPRNQLVNSRPQMYAIADCSYVGE